MARKQLGAAPSGTTDTATKSYVDTAIATTVTLTGNQSIAGNKTFTGATTTKDVTVQANTGDTARVVLNNLNGQVYEFGNNNGGTFSVYDSTHSKSVLSIDANAPVGAIAIDTTDINIGCDLNAAGHFVWNLTDPVDAQDATTKSYVDTAVATLINPTITNYTESVVAKGTVTTASTISLTSGTVQTATLTASTACTFTMPTATAGKSFTLLLKQAAATGNGSATFTGVKWPSAGAPTITATAGKMDILTFVADGASWYGSYLQGYTP